MRAGKKPKGKGAVSENGLADQHVHLIRVPGYEALKRAIMILGEVRVPHCGLTDSRFLVAKEHLEALRREEIPFEQLA